MGELGGAPRSRELFHALDRLARRRQLEARELVLCVTGEIGDVGRKVGRQAQGADFICEPQPPEMLHGAGLRCVGLRIESRGRLLIHENGRHAAPPQLVGKHEATRAAADDEHGTVAWRCGHLPFSLGGGIYCWQRRFQALWSCSWGLNFRH